MDHDSKKGSLANSLIVIFVIILKMNNTVIAMIRMSNIYIIISLLEIRNLRRWGRSEKTSRDSVIPPIILATTTIIIITIIACSRALVNGDISHCYLEEEGEYNFKASNDNSLVKK